MSARVGAARPLAWLIAQEARITKVLGRRLDRRRRNREVAE